MCAFERSSIRSTSLDFTRIRLSGRIRGRIFFYSLEDWMRNEDRWRRIESYMRSVSFFAPTSDFAIELIVVANFRLKAMEALIAKKNAKKRRQKKKWEQSPTAQRPSGPTIFMFIRLHFKQSSCADSVSRTLGQWFQIEHVITCMNMFNCKILSAPCVPNWHVANMCPPKGWL